jgi:hypothetical protein
MAFKMKGFSYAGKSPVKHHNWDDDGNTIHHDVSVYKDDDGVLQHYTDDIDAEGQFLGNTADLHPDITKKWLDSGMYWYVLRETDMTAQELDLVMFHDSDKLYEKESSK